MYCNNCGKNIDEDSLFCQSCGHKVNIGEAKDNSKKSSKANQKESSNDLLWTKFVDIHDAKDDERAKYHELSSSYIWELVERLYTNAFETFIQDNKDTLNSQPYKVIEGLKELYILAVIGGYKLWIAEAIISKKMLVKFKPFDIDKFIEEWKAYDFQKSMNGISDEMGNCMTLYLEHRMNSFIESFPSAKEMPNAIIADLRSSITFQIINGYFAGEVESKFRI